MTYKRGAMELSIGTIIIIILIMSGILLLAWVVESHPFMYQDEYDIYERIFTNYTVQEDRTNYSVVYYKQPISFILAPIEEYSVSSIINLIPIHKFDPICISSSSEYYDKFCGSYYGCQPQSWILEIQQMSGCFDFNTTQKIVNYTVINNSNIRQVGDILKNLDTVRQSITIITEIENTTPYVTKINVVKVNETILLIGANKTGKLNLGVDLYDEWLNANATCQNSICPSGYEDWAGECYKCGLLCDWFDFDYKTTPKICDSWVYQDKYIIEKVK